MTLFRCGGQAQWTGDHIGCAKSAPYCTVSTNYAGLRNRPIRTQSCGRHISPKYL